MPEFFFHISEGKLTNPYGFDKRIANLKDGWYFCEKGKRRSDSQNRFYWGCVLSIVKEGLQQVGYREVKTNEDAHEILKFLFLKKKMINEVNGEEIIIPGSTQKLTTVEFMAYIEEITQWSASYLGCIIPNPGEQATMFGE
jgi:hypothetical protein